METKLTREQQRAINSGRDYFTELIQSFKCKIEAIEKNQRDWKVLAKTIWNDKPIHKFEDPQNLLGYINSTISDTSQIDIKTHQAMRAMLQLMKAFDLN